MWKQNLGVEVELANEEWKVFLNTREQGDFQIARHAYVTIFFDAGSLLEGWVTGSPKNVARYSDPEYDVDVQGIVRETLREIGYDRAKYGFDCETCGVINMIHGQSPDIAQGVDGTFARANDKDEAERIDTGDQGITQ